MAEENKNTIEQEAQQVVNEPKDNDITKVKMKKFEQVDDVVKVDLSKPPPSKKLEEDSTQEKEENEELEEDVIVVNEDSKTEESENKKDDDVEEQKEEDEEEKETPVLEEITDDDIDEIEEQVEEAVEESIKTGEEVPDNIQNLLDFMEETGGDIEDYVNLNRDISKMDISEVLDEYYRVTKSHLTPEERGFLLEDTFGYDEEVDDEKTIRKKQIALKEQVAEARAYLDGQKSKYYKEIKAGSKLTQEQQKAIDFFNRYEKESEHQKKLSEANQKDFRLKTNNVFNDKFKGFDYQVGDKKFRFNVKDMGKVKQTQSDLNNFINNFVDKDNKFKDAEGYHKSLFTAMNADAIAKHFYEQGKADAIKGQIAKDKNIDTSPRQTHGEINAGGLKVKVLGQSSSDMKNRSFKIRKKN